MAILAVFSNAAALAAEIEARNSALQAIKEGRLPLLPEAAPAAPIEPPKVPLVPSTGAPQVPAPTV